MNHLISIILAASLTTTVLGQLEHPHHPIDSSLQADARSTDESRSISAVRRLRTILDDAESPYERRLWALDGLPMARGGAAEAVDALLDLFSDDLHPLLGPGSVDRLISARPASAEIRAELDNRLATADGFSIVLLKLKALLFSPESVTQNLLQLLGDDDDHVAARASLIIRGMLHDLRPDLFRILDQPYGPTTDMIVDIIGDAGLASDEELQKLLAVLHDESGHPRPRIAWALGNLGRRAREHLAARFLQGDAVDMALLRAGAPDELSEILDLLAPESSSRANVGRILLRASQEKHRRWATMGGLAFSARWDSRVIQAGQAVRMEIEVWNVGSTPVGVLKDMPWAGSNWMDIRFADSDGVLVAAVDRDNPLPRLSFERDFVVLLPGEQRAYAIEFNTRRVPGAAAVQIDTMWPFVLTIGHRYQARVTMNSRNPQDTIRAAGPGRVWNGIVPLPREPIEIR